MDHTVRSLDTYISLPGAPWRKTMYEHPIRSACDLLFAPKQTVEVRLIGKRGTASGFFDDYDRLTAAVGPFNNRGEYGGIYVTLNPVNPDLLARRANRIETRLGKDERSAADSDILSRRWLPIDIDPVRPSGVSSSEEEHTAAAAKATEIATYLTGIGWPQPVVADSGNGAHLLFRIDLPNDEPSQQLVKEVLETLHVLFSDEKSAIDTSVFNASRIWKLYGTCSRKGDNVPSRPHRTASLLSVPSESGIVTVEQLTQLTRMLPHKQPAVSGKDQKGGVTIELGSWLAQYRIGFTQRPYAGGSLFVLDECPFSSDHTDGAYAIQFSNGAIFAGCHHTSCGGGRQRWAELRERSEGTIPDRLKRLTSSKNPREPVQHSDSCHAQSGDNRKHAPATPPPSDETIHTATTVLTQGNPLGYMLETFMRDHIGDAVVAECLVMSLASRQVINAKGLHVSVTGESGKGKSHAFETMMLQVPDELRLEGRMSDKALFYIKDLRPGTVIVLDDVSLSDQMQEILKGVTTSFKKPFRYRTVNKDRGGETCIIPERCVWWVAKVDGTGDDQVWNRMLTCWIDDSEEQDTKVLEQTLHRAADPGLEHPEIRPEIAVCQEIWRSLPPVWVVVPFAERIRFSSAMNRRNPDMLLDLVRAHAVLMQHQRRKIESAGMTRVLATVEDFEQAQRLYMALNSSSGGQDSKLTRRESELVDAVRSHGQGEITIAEMQHCTGWSFSVIFKMLHGSSSKGHEYSGLLEKCPAVSVCERTLVTDESGTTAAHRRAKAYSWDERVYRAWVSEGGCWLDPPGPDDADNFHEPNEPDDTDPHCGTADGCGHTAEISATDPGIKTGSDQEYLSNNNYVRTYCGNDENTEQPTRDQTGISVHPSDPDSSAIRDLTSGSGDDTSPVLEIRPSDYCPDFRNMSAVSHNGPQWDTTSATSDQDEPGRIGTIRASDFCAIDRGFDSGPCDCCGSSWVHYQERMTRQRLHEPPRLNRKICRICYEQAKKRESASVRVLPGLLTISGMSRLQSDLGRCQVCDLNKAVWYDTGSKTAICESCRLQVSHEGEL